LTKKEKDHGRAAPRIVIRSGKRGGIEWKRGQPGDTASEYGWGPEGCTFSIEQATNECFFNFCMRGDQDRQFINMYPDGVTSDARGSSRSRLFQRKLNSKVRYRGGEVPATKQVRQENIEDETSITIFVREANQKGGGINALLKISLSAGKMEKNLQNYRKTTLDHNASGLIDQWD